MNKIKIKIKSYDHALVDKSSKNIIDLIKQNKGEFSGPIPLPTKKEIYTIIRAVHKYKDSREQFEIRTHKRLIEVNKYNEDLEKKLRSIELPTGVEIEIK